MNKPDQFPALKILSGKHKGKRFRLIHQRVIIGSDSSCDVIFKGSGLSKRQALIKKAQGVCFIENLDSRNPCKVNKKKLTSSYILKDGDKIQLGNIQFQFSETVKQKAFTPPAVKTNPSSSKFLSPTRVLLIALILGGGFLFLYEGEEEKEEAKKLLIKKETEILKEARELEEKIEEESKEAKLKPKQKHARTAFIKGFRDYNKGYFSRANKLFLHCLSLDKENQLCRRYSGKAKAQMDNLIQKKMRLGKAYQKNKQYEACQAAFKSVEIMVSDVKSPIYKEASVGRKACETKLENTI